MDKLINTHEKLTNALSTLQRAKDTLAIFVKEGVSYNPHIDYKEEYRGLRDSAIQRFEYSFDLFWKYLKRYLEKIAGLSGVNGPRPVIKKSFALQFLTEKQAEKALLMLDDRNLTSHVYIEDVAEKLAEGIPAYYELMNAIAKNLGPEQP